MHFTLMMSTTSSSLSITTPPGFSTSLNLVDTNRFIATHFTTIHRELVHASISLKKLRKIAKERDEDKWAEFVQWMSQYSPEEIGFIDETSKDKRTTFRWNGHSRKGMHTQRRGFFVWGCRLSAIGLLTLDGMEAYNVIKGSFTMEKFIHFLEHDVVSFLFISQFYWWQVIASYHYVPHTLVLSLSLLWTMHTSTTTRESKSLFRMLVSVVEVPLHSSCWLGFRCLPWVSPAVLPQLEPDQGSVFQDQGIPLPQWRCCHCWWWNCFWYVQCHGYHYTRQCCHSNAQRWISKTMKRLHIPMLLPKWKTVGDWEVGVPSSQERYSSGHHHILTLNIPSGLIAAWSSPGGCCSMLFPSWTSCHL